MDTSKANEAVIILSDMVGVPFRVIFQSYDDNGNPQETSVQTDDFNEVPLLLREKLN